MTKHHRAISRAELYPPKFSRKKSAQNEAIFRGQNLKNEEKLKKNFIVPKRSLGHTDHLYTYKRYIEHVGFT